MNYQDKYETLKHAAKLSLINYQRSTLGLNEVEKAHYTELWMQGSKDWIQKLEAADKEMDDEL